MENPVTWGQLEYVIDAVLKRIEEKRYSPGFMAGLSETMQIANALREAGLVKEISGDHG